MLLSLSTLLPSSSHPTLSHSLHFLSPSSPTDFMTPLFSPIPSEPERKLVPPQREFDLAIANLVAHHVDDLDGWMEGAVGLLRKGGWLVVTEFGKEEGGKDVAGEVRTEKEKERQEELQNVNAGARAEAGEAGEESEVSCSHRRYVTHTVSFTSDDRIEHHADFSALSLSTCDPSRPRPPVLRHRPPFPSAPSPRAASTPRDTTTRPSPLPSSPLYSRDTGSSMCMPR